MPKTYILAKGLWELGQKIGLTSENSSDTGMRSTVGKIQHTSDNIKNAEAYQTRMQAQRLLDNRLAEFKKLQLNLDGLDHSKEMNAMAKEIITINNQLQDKDLQERADAYELEQADKEAGILEKIPRAFSSLVTQLSGTDADKKAWVKNNKNIVLK